MVKHSDKGTWLEQIAQDKGSLTCATSWAAMAGDERERFCDRCQKNVINLSDMTAREAEARLWSEYRDSGKVPCVTLVVDEDGAIVVKPEARASLRSAGPARLLALGLAASLPLAGCQRRAFTTTGEPMPPASSLSSAQGGPTMLTGLPPVPADGGPTGTPGVPEPACSSSAQHSAGPVTPPPPPGQVGSQRLAGAPRPPHPQLKAVLAGSKKDSRL
jgi:hypothetical protein